MDSASAPVAATDRGTARSEMRALAASWAERGIEEAEALAALADEMGLVRTPEAVEALVQVVGPARCVELLEAGAELAASRHLLEVISQAAGQAAHVVGALRGYLQGGDDEELLVADVGKGIDAILSLLHHRTKRGVSVERRLEPGLLVRANPNRLGQVWLNLLNNALQAMAYHGKLGIEARQEGASVRVDIVDSGPGIPEEVKPRIFEPFFTTKRQGEGIGLGLDICRKIVERYGGSIAFESEPGRTVFTVVLPVATGEDGPGGS
jgi:signal transduction histidine kinase